MSFFKKLLKLIADEIENYRHASAGDMPYSAGNENAADESSRIGEETRPYVRSSVEEEEIKRVDEIEAISPIQRNREYLLTLHPLVRACYLYTLRFESEPESEISTSDALSVFHHWGYPSGSYTFKKTERQEELIRMYESQKEELWRQKEEAANRFLQIHKESEAERERAWEEYFERYRTLPESIKPFAAYGLAKCNASSKRNDLTSKLGRHCVSLPFSFCGYTTYEHPKWGESYGVAFRINTECFGDRTPLLYYLDDDNWPESSFDDTPIESLLELSSGIASVRTEGHVCKGWDGKEKERCVVLFELDPSAIKKEINLNGTVVSTEKAGEYILVVPRSGEFYCLLGEVLNGEMIPLQKDDFCMK